MHYFLTDIHGASKAYFDIKERMPIKNNDELYILGDIFDGNTDNPKACIDILGDVMAHNNYHLILGDHEYIHIMYEISKEKEEINKVWNSIIKDPDFHGMSLHKYIYNNLSEKERNYYFSFLMQCDLSDCIKIGDRIFYLVHGSPCPCNNENIIEWQSSVCMTPINLATNYQYNIIKDPCGIYPKDGKKEKTYIMCGHIPVQEYQEDKKKAEIIISNHKILLDCGCSADDFNMQQDVNLACMAIDAAGYYVEYYTPLVERKIFHE